MAWAAICWCKVEEDGASPIFVSLLRSARLLTERTSMQIFDNLRLLVLILSHLIKTHNYKYKEKETTL